ncbi:hypothetical protein DL98DRAFT_36939 [Cadophora sp. DSE1049]|nr:hypothetical protein DL98DRAFT_36939 [Cadophora sp. DSE1049]
MNSTPMVYSNTGTPLNDPEHIRWQRAVRLDLVASRSYNNTEMDMDMPAPTPEPVKALRDEELQFVRAQQALNLSPTASNNASAMSETTEMDFTSTNGITGAEVQFKREQGALQSTSQQDDDMDIECGNLNSNTGMEYMELGKVRRQREQHFSQPRPTIEETLPQQKEYYVSVALLPPAGLGINYPTEPKPINRRTRSRIRNARRP